MQIDICNQINTFHYSETTHYEKNKEPNTSKLTNACFCLQSFLKESLSLHVKVQQGHLGFWDPQKQRDIRESRRWPAVNRLHRSFKTLTTRSCRHNRETQSEALLKWWWCVYRIRSFPVNHPSVAQTNLWQQIQCFTSVLLSQRNNCWFWR